MWEVGNLGQRGESRRDGDVWREIGTARTQDQLNGDSDSCIVVHTILVDRCVTIQYRICTVLDQIMSIRRYPPAVQSYA